MQLEKEKVILDFRERLDGRAGVLTGQYAHLVGEKIYWQLFNGSSNKIIYANKNGESFDQPENNTVLDNSLAAHNFVAFEDTNPNTPKDERYKAIGGYHVGRFAVKKTNPTDDEIRNAQIHPSLNDCEVSQKADVVGVIDHMWPEETKVMFKDDFHHPRHANGFYIFKSHDGLDWKLYYDKPVISGLTYGEGDFAVCADSMPSIFYDHNINEYVVYLRCNIKLGVRHVFYSKSKDLINWDTPKFIKKSPEFDLDNESLYYMGAYPLSNGKYIAFAPHFKNYVNENNKNDRTYGQGKTLVMLSEDGINWEVIDEIFKTENTGHMTQPHVYAFLEKEQSLYVHEGFLTTKNYLSLYKFDETEFTKLISK